MNNPFKEIGCVEVCDSREQDVVSYFTYPPREAVIAAYAQDRRNWDRSTYEYLYSHLVYDGRTFFACGDFLVDKEVVGNLP